MSLKTRAQLRQEIAENLGILDTDQNEAFDATTTPSLTRVNQYINDALREITSNYPYDITERNCMLPFYHTVSNVPAATLYDASANTGVKVPYPDNDALTTMCYTLEPNHNFSGVSFTDTGGTARTSTSGVSTTADWTGVGYMYEMPTQVDKIIDITVPDKSIKLQFIPYYDFQRKIPQGLSSSTSSTPAWYTIQNGMSASGNTMVQFYPMPDATLSGTHFQVHYNKKEPDLTVDTEVPDVVPDNFQDITVHAVLEKCYILLTDLEKAQVHGGYKMQRLMQLRKWCENNPDFANRYRDAHYLSSSTYATGADLATGYMINGFGN